MGSIGQGRWSLLKSLFTKRVLFGGTLLTWCLSFHLGKKSFPRSWNVWSLISSFVTIKHLNLIAAYNQYLKNTLVQKCFTYTSMKEQNSHVIHQTVKLMYEDACIVVVCTGRCHSWGIISHQSSFDPVGVAYSASAFFHFSIKVLFTGSSIFRPLIRLLCNTISGHFFEGSFCRIPLAIKLT